MSKPVLLSAGNGKVLELAGSADNDVLTWNATSQEWESAAGGGGGSGVTSVTASAPLASSGGATPDISLTGTVGAANGGTGLGAPVAGDAGKVLAAKADGTYELVVRGTGTVTSVTGGTGLSGGTITDSGTLSVNYGTSSGTAAEGNDARLSDARTPTGSAGGDLSGTYPDPTVAKLQGFSVSTTDPTVGKILQYTGTEWAPADAPQGGSGGGGVMYYFNKGTARSGGNLPANTYQLGRTAETGQTSVALTNLAVGSWTRVGGFVTDAGDPAVTTVPAGLWDFNLWVDSTAAANNQAFVRLTLYAYDGSTNPEAGTALAQTDNVYLYDAGVIAQYIAAMLIAGGTTLPSTSTRLYLLIEAQASTSNRDVTVYFGNSTPSHTHSTIPSVGGTGLVHVIDGVFQSPASLLVDADVAASGTANIARNKLASGTAHAIGVNDSSGYLTSAAALTNGQLLVGSTGAAPVAAAISQGTGVTVSNGAGSIQIGIGQSVATSASPTFAGATLTGLTGYLKGNSASALSASATVPASDVTSIPYDLSGDAYGSLSSGETIFRFIAPRNITLTALSQAGGATVKVQVAGSDVTLPGSVNVTSGQVVSVLTTSAGTDAYFTITAVVA